MIEVLFQNEDETSGNCAGEPESGCSVHGSFKVDGWRKPMIRHTGGI